MTIEKADLGAKTIWTIRRSADTEPSSRGLSATAPTRTSSTVEALGVAHVTITAPLA